MLNIKRYKILLISVFSFLIASCLRETELPVNVKISTEVIGDYNTTPLSIELINNTTGAENYSWIFDGGTPATSNKKTPGKVTFTQPGEHKITLKAWNIAAEDTKTIIVRVDSLVTVNFSVEALINEFAPATIKITNTTKGAGSYLWYFEGANINQSEDKEPLNVVFNSPGEHKIKLEATNGSQTFSLEKKITILSALNASFTMAPIASDEDLEAPATLELSNTSVNSLNVVWECDGGIIADKTANTTTVRFESAGTYTVKLIADNNKEYKTVSQQIDIKENAGVFIFEDIKLGINEAKNSIGALFSVELKKVILSKDVTANNGSKIDFGFFALNSAFDYCYFFSPDKAADAAFAEIPGAIQAYINNNPLPQISGSEFDNIHTMSDLSYIMFPSSGDNQTLNLNTITLPYVIKLRTQSGRNGLVKIKQVVKQGADSYIIADIKTEKLSGE